jgi:hypothetical protein
MRQNLAYVYALAGRWKEARLMAAQDVPANLVGDRMEEWSRMARPQAWQARVAALLGAPAGVVDAGQPVQLALANNPGVEQLASEATADAAPKAQLALNAPAATQELPAAEDAVPQLAVAPAPAPKAEEPSTFQAAFASVAEAAQDALRFVSQPVVQALPARHEPKPRVTKAVAVEQANGTHLVQLGSFASEQSARRAWSIYAKRYPSLAGHRMVITEAVVRGKHYWRVSAAGFGPVTSQAMCGRVKSVGEGCFAYAEGRPLPGAVESGTRLALR